MSRHAPTKTANDNDPRVTRPAGDSVGFRAMLREQELERRLQALEIQQTAQGAPIMISHSSKPKTRWGIISSLFCTLLATLGAAYCFYSGQGAVLSIVALVAMVWSALWVTFLGSEESNPAPFVSEFSIVLATIAGLGVWVLTSREWGLPLRAADGAAGFAGLTALIAVLLRSRLTLLMSVCGGLVWLALYTAVPSINMVSIWAYPLLALIQLFIAGQNGVKFPTVLALIGAHGWLFWILNERLMAGDISLFHIAAFSTLIGLAHYRLGKAAGDKQWDSANMHVVFGWALAMAGAVGLQHYWLGIDPALWQDMSVHPLGQLSWQIVGGVCIALIGIAGLIRMAHRQMSTLAVLFSLGVALAAAALFDQRVALTSFIQTELNTPAKPLVGLIISASILASAIAMCVNGARRKSMLMMLAGLAVLAIELVLMFNPRFWTAETALVFGMGLLASLCFAALFSADAFPANYA